MNLIENYWNNSHNKFRWIFCKYSIWRRFYDFIRNALDTDTWKWMEEKDGKKSSEDAAHPFLSQLTGYWFIACWFNLMVHLYGICFEQGLFLFMENRKIPERIQRRILFNITSKYKIQMKCFGKCNETEKDNGNVLFLLRELFYNDRKYLSLSFAFSPRSKDIKPAKALRIRKQYWGS